MEPGARPACRPGRRRSPVAGDHRGMKLDFPPPPPTSAADELRREIRAFLATELADRPAAERARSWSGSDPEFSRKLGARGWIGMTWPKRYGGGERNGP